MKFVDVMRSAWLRFVLSFFRFWKLISLKMTKERKSQNILSTLMAGTEGRHEKYIFVKRDLIFP